MGAATATATAMTMGVAPVPAANAAISVDIPGPTPGDPLASITLPVGLYTTGLPFRILDLIGQGLTPDDLPVDVTLIEFLSALDPQAFYNRVNATPFGAEVSLDNPLGDLGGLPEAVLNPLLEELASLALGNLGLDLQFEGDDINLGVNLPLRAIVIASFGFASYTTMDTYRKLAESTRTGEAPAPGYTPVEQAPDFEEVELNLEDLGVTVPPALATLLALLGVNINGDIADVDLPSIPNITLLALALIRDPGRPNGGIGARFAPLFAPFGIDTVTPDVMPVWPEGFEITEPISLELGNGCGAFVCVGTTWNGGAALIPIHLNLGWQYDPVSDFPATANPVSIANSLVAGLLPTYILRKPDLEGLTRQLGDIDLVSVLTSALGQGTDEEIADALNIYVTLGSDALPLLEPGRLLVDVINLFTGLGLGTPISDAIEPALKILTNIGYTNVVTPSDLATGNYPADIEAYERYLDDDSMATPTPFFSQTIDLQEALAVPGDVINALITGFSDTFDEDFKLFDPARNNALRTLLEALGVDLPSLDLGSTLQSAVPDLSETFSALESGDAGSRVASTSVDVTADESDSENEDLADTTLDDGDDILDENDGTELDETELDEEGDSEAEQTSTSNRPSSRILSQVRDLTRTIFNQERDEDESEQQESNNNEDADEDETVVDDDDETDNTSEPSADAA